MKTAKRVLAVLIAAILALAVFAFPASAVDGTMSFTIDTVDTEYAPGDLVTVNVYVSSDFKATCMRIPVLYSKDVFELPAGNDVRLAAYGDCLSKKNSLEANTDMSDTPIDLMNVTTAYDSSSYGIVAIQWTASITSSTINSFYSETAVKCFSFQLKVKSSASGVGTILIPEADQLTPAFAFYNQTVIDPADATTICRVNATFSVDEWSIEIAEGTADDITTFPDSEVIIDRENKILKNWEDGVTKTVIQSNVTTTGNATLTYKASATSGSWGTGAKVRLWVGSTWISDYTVLLYGDIDGNGSIKATDVTALSKHLAGVTDLEADDVDPVLQLAADVDGNGSIKATDITVLSKYLSGVTEISQAM